METNQNGEGVLRTVRSSGRMSELRPEASSEGDLGWSDGEREEALPQEATPIAIDDEDELVTFGTTRHVLAEVQEILVVTLMVWDDVLDDFVPVVHLRDLDGDLICVLDSRDLEPVRSHGAVVLAENALEAFYATEV